MNILIIIIAIISFIIYYQYVCINKRMSRFTYEIIQVNNPNKETFEKIIEEKQPSVFTNILESIDFSKYNLTDKNSKLDFKNDLNKHFKYYLDPLCLKYKFDINETKKEEGTPIFRQTHYRYLLCQVEGIKKILLFSPNQEKYLYPDLKFNKSRVDFWNFDNRKEHKLFNKSKYIEIIIKQNQMLYIPYGWWYTTIDLTDSFSISSSCESIFSYFLKK